MRAQARTLAQAFVATTTQNHTDTQTLRNARTHAHTYTPTHTPHTYTPITEHTTVHTRTHAHTYIHPTHIHTNQRTQDIGFENFGVGEGEVLHAICNEEAETADSVQ